MNKFTKIILLVFSTLFAWTPWLVSSFSCAWSSGSIEDHFSCEISVPLYFILACVISILCLLILVILYKKLKFFNYKKLALLYLFLFFFILVIITLNLFLTDYQKTVYLSGMTLNSCAEGKSIYPWGVTFSSRIHEDPFGKKYARNCYLFHNKCEMIVDGSLDTLQTLCYRRNGYSFDKYEDCAILTINSTSRKICEQFFLRKK